MLSGASLLTRAAPIVEEGTDLGRGAGLSFMRRKEAVWSPGGRAGLMVVNALNDGISPAAMPERDCVGPCVHTRRV